MVLLINSAENQIDEYIRPIAEILKQNGIVYEVRHYSDQGMDTIMRFDRVIISGSPRGDDIVVHHSPYFSWIKSVDKAVFGICAGHHIIGYIYGSQLIRDKEGAVGELMVRVQHQDAIFSGLSTEFPVQENHNDAITLPDQFLLLASSDVCTVEMMRHRQRPIYSSQFHPEYLNPQLLLNFIRMPLAT